MVHNTRVPKIRSVFWSLDLPPNPCKGAALDRFLGHPPLCGSEEVANSLPVLRLLQAGDRQLQDPPGGFGVAAAAEVRRAAWQLSGSM